MKYRTSGCIVLIVGTMLVLILNSCHKKNEDATSTKQYATLGNLQTAYAAETRHYRWYTRFSQQAQTERLVDVADLYNAAAQSEKIHAENHAIWIRAMGTEPIEPPIDSIPQRTTYQILRLSLRTEIFECESLYPMMIRTAEIEKLSDCVKELKQTTSSDARQRELFEDAVQRSSNIVRVTYQVCPSCGFIVTSVKTERCPVCSTQREQFKKI